MEELLHKIVGGAIEKGSSPAVLEQVRPDRPLLGSVRDPWGWYLSLWRAGCAEKGELYARLTDDRTWHKLLEKMQAADAGGGPAGEPPGKRVQLPDQLGADRAKNFWYADARDPQAFREWLRVLLAKQTRRVVDPAYAQSGVSKMAGLMTYRYFALYVRGGNQLPVTISTPASLRAFETEHLLARRIVRQDCLTDDLVSALTEAGVALDDAQRKLIYDARPRDRDRHLEIQRFYDAPSAEMVARREAFIIERFGYELPAL